jgi:hypothetical protein
VRLMGVGRRPDMRGPTALLAELRMFPTGRDPMVSDSGHAQPFRAAMTAQLNGDEPSAAYPHVTMRSWLACP